MNEATTWSSYINALNNMKFFTKSTYEKNQHARELFISVLQKEATWDADATITMTLLRAAIEVKSLRICPCHGSCLTTDYKKPSIEVPSY